jgi:hypothetical protein
MSDPLVTYLEDHMAGPGTRPRNAHFLLLTCVMNSVYERRVWSGG